MVVKSVPGIVGAFELASQSLLLACSLETFQSGNQSHLNWCFLMMLL